MTANGPIYARIKDGAGTVVKTAEGKVSNIDKTAPLASIYEDYQTSTGKARVSVDVADYETEIDYVLLPDGTKKYIEDERKDNIKIVVIEDKRTNASVNGWQINVEEALKDFTNVTFKTDITQSELVNSDYDIVISNMGVWTSEKPAMLEAAFKAGKDVITIGNDANSSYYVIDTDTAFSATPDNTKGKKVATNEITEKINFNGSVYDGIHLINQAIDGFEDWYRYETGGQEYTAMGMYEENGARWFHSSAPEIQLQTIFPYLIRKLTRVTTATYEIPKSGTYTFKVYDKAGNCTEKTITTGNYKITYDFNEDTLQNGDFQGGTANWAISNSYVTATADTGVKYKNKQTMRLTTTANGTWNGITNSTISRQYYPNTLYKLSAVAYKDDNSSYGAYKNNYNIYIPQFNGETRQDIGLGYLTLNKNKSWTKFEQEFTTTGTEWLGVYAVYNQGSGVQASNLWLGNIRVERIQNATIGYGNTLGTLPTPTRYGYIFNGWYTEPTGGKQIKSTDKILPQNTTYYAHWTQANYAVNTSPEKYTVTLAEAVAASNSAGGSTITMIRDYTDSSVVNIDRNVTLTTNGKTLTRTGTITVNSGKTLTLTGTGTLQTGSAINLITNKGTLNVTHTGTIRNTNTSTVSTPSVMSVINNTGTLNITSAVTMSAAGQISSTNTDPISAIRNESSGTTVISNARISATDGAVVNYGNLTVSSGTLTGGRLHAVKNCAGTFTMNNGTLTKTNTQEYSVLCNYNSATATINGGTITGATGAITTYTGKLYVKGGTITSTNNTAILTSVAGGTVEITGGNIKGKDHGVRNRAILKISGSSTKIASDTKNGVQNIENGEVTFNSGTITAYSEAGAVSNQGKSFTMTGGTLTKSITDASKSGMALSNYNGATTTITGGTITSTGSAKGSAVHGYGGTIIMYNGTIDGKENGVNLEGSTYLRTYGGTIRGNTTGNAAISVNGSATAECSNTSIIANYSNDPVAINNATGSGSHAIVRSRAGNYGLTGRVAGYVIATTNASTGQSSEVVRIFNASTSTVFFPTWTDANGQDDIVWYKTTKASNYNEVRIYKSNHKNESGRYNVHIYDSVDGGTARNNIGAVALDF